MPAEPADVGSSLYLPVVLAELGVPQADIDQAIADDTLSLLALERFSIVEQPEYDLEEVSARSGADPDIVRAYWRALGFPDPRPGEKVFTAADLDLLDLTLSHIADESLDKDLALQMSRVIGAAMDKVATAQVDALEAQSYGDASDRLVQTTGSETIELLSMVPQVMGLVWRRQLGVAARRRRMRAASEASRAGVLVGFADLVGFTAKTQQLEEQELAEVVGRFEYIAFDVVAAHGGRVIKMIGDEVMFIHEDLRQGAELALALAEQFRNDPNLSDVRVGLASGSVLERDGDVYGHVVNVASRIVSIAYPGSVVVSQEVHDALVGNEAFVLRSLRSHYLKDVGKVPLWTLRRGDDATERPYAHARENRSRREFLRERYGELVVGAELTDDLPPALRDEIRDSERSDSPSTGQYEAIAAAVLSADIEPTTQVELLAELEADRRLRTLEAEAQAKATEADVEAERRLDQIDRDVRRKVQEIELEARRRIDRLLEEAEEQSRQANEDASLKVQRVAAETERKAEKAAKEAKADAQRRTKRARKT